MDDHNLLVIQISPNLPDLWFPTYNLGSQIPRQQAQHFEEWLDFDIKWQYYN